MSMYYCRERVGRHSPLPNFTKSDVQVKHVCEFLELVGSLNGYFEGFLKFDPEFGSSFELLNQNRY